MRNGLNNLLIKAIEQKTFKTYDAPHARKGPGRHRMLIGKRILIMISFSLLVLLPGISCNTETRTREDCEELLTLYTGFLFLRYEDIRTNPDLAGSQRNSARIETNYSFFLLVEDYEDCLEEAPKMPGFL